LECESIFQGLAEAAIGTSTLVFALPVGWLADKLPRHHVIGVGGSVSSLAATVITVHAVTRPIPPDIPGEDEADAQAIHAFSVDGYMDMYGET
jgi:hypothetical protein